MKLSIPVCSRFIFYPVAQWTTPLTAILSETTALYIPTHCFSKISIYFHKHSMLTKLFQLTLLFIQETETKLWGGKSHENNYGNCCTCFLKLLTSIGSPPVGAIVGAILVVVVVVVLGITTGLIACRQQIMIVLASIIASTKNIKKLLTCVYYMSKNVSAFGNFQIFNFIQLFILCYS